MTTNQNTASTRARVAAALMAAILLLVAGRAQAQNYTIAPIPFLYVWNTSGAIVPNGCVWTYAAGTTTPIATYSNTSGTQNGNPIVADVYGRFVAYLLPGTNYKFVYESTPCSGPSTHGTELKSQDNIQGVPSSASTVDIVGTAGEAIAAGQCVYLSDGSGGKTQGQYYKCDSATTYSSTLPVVGFAPSAISSATTGTIRLAGSLTGLSSLTVAAPYYVSGTAGAITSTAPANRRYVGAADSTTSIIVASNPALMTAAASGTASSTTFLRGDQTWSTPWTVISPTTTGTVNDWAPATIVGNTEIRCNNASLLTVQGIAAGYDGQLLRIVSVGAGQVDLAPQNAGSSAANRLLNFATAGSTSLAAGSGYAEYQYDTTTARWRLLVHEQGAWITATFNGANFTGNNSMTWTVGSGDVTTLAYRLSGRTLFVNYSLSATTVAGTPSTSLQIANGAYGGYTWTRQVLGANAYVDNGANNTPGVLQISASGTNIANFRAATAAWTASTDNTSVSGFIAGEVN
jgi:hypothetical protein